MKLINIIVVLLLFIYNGYADDSNTETTFNADNKSGIACPSTDFTKFIQIFIHDITIQKKFTKFPLKKLIFDHNEWPESKEVIISSDQINLFAQLREDNEKNKLFIRLDKVTYNTAEITLTDGDSGYLVYYFFEKDDCWYLIGIEDWST
ncbi:MAG: hypothetical protein HQM06_03600 [Magnetococcales bacterium]|nr:hypothetical protein [Magnetococcales bacterium]